MNSLKGPGKQIGHYTLACRVGQKPSSGQSSTIYSLINEQQSRHQEGCLTNYEPLKKSTEWIRPNSFTGLRML